MIEWLAAATAGVAGLTLSWMLTALYLAARADFLERRLKHRRRQLRHLEWEIADIDQDCAHFERLIRELESGSMRQSLERLAAR